MSLSLQPHFELVKESQDGRVYKIEAIHVTTSGNNRRYTESELKLAARSLSFRPLNINHQPSRGLTYPANMTLAMEYDPDRRAVTGKMLVQDRFVNNLIDSGQINKLSIEHIPKSESCASETIITEQNGQKVEQQATVCEQQGIIFTALALLTKDTMPGDSMTSITRESKTETTLSDMCSCYQSNKQQESATYDTAKGAVDSATSKDGNDAMASCIKSKMDGGMSRDDAILACKNKDKVEAVDADGSDEMSACVKKYISHGKDRDQAVAICKNELKTSNESIISSGSSLTKQNQIADIMAVNEVQNKDNSEVKVKSESQPQQQQTTSNTNQPEFIKILESVNDGFKSLQQLQLDKLSEILGALNKKESNGKPSSIVTDATTVHAESYGKVADWFTKAKERGASIEAMGWYTSKDDYLKAHSTFATSGAISHALNSVVNKEALTVTGGDMPQYYSKQLIILPGGRMKVPIRQYCNFVKLENADRANWYKIGGVDFGAITEGSEPSAAAQTITKITAVPAVRGVLQKIGYTQVENAPFDLLQAINDAMTLAAIDDETTECLTTTYDAITPSNWVNGATGATITGDDVASMSMQREGVLAAKRKIAEQGHDVSPGNLVLYLTPKAYTDLMLDSDLNSFYQMGRPDITATGMLEQVYGVDIVISDHLKAMDNTTNDTHRNVMFVKNYAFGLASARDVTFEADRRNELQQIFVTATHRVKAAVIDETATCRISTAQ